MNEQITEDLIERVAGENPLVGMYLKYFLLGNELNLDLFLSFMNEQADYGSILTPEDLVSPIKIICFGAYHVREIIWKAFEEQGSSN